MLMGTVITRVMKSIRNPWWNLNQAFFFFFFLLSSDGKHFARVKFQIVYSFNYYAVSVPIFSSITKSWILKEIRALLDF